MRRKGSLVKIEEIEKLLLGLRYSRVERTSGKQGDYAGMGEAGTSKLFGKKILINMPIVVNFEHDERNGEGIIRIRDDHIGRLCTMVPGLIERIAELTDLGDGQYMGIKKPVKEVGT